MATVALLLIAGAYSIYKRPWGPKIFYLLSPHHTKVTLHSGSSSLISPSTYCYVNAPGISDAWNFVNFAFSGLCPGKQGFSLGGLWNPHTYRCCLFLLWDSLLRGKSQYWGLIFGSSLSLSPRLYLSMTRRVFLFLYAEKLPFTASFYSCFIVSS